MWHSVEGSIANISVDAMTVVSVCEVAVVYHNSVVRKGSVESLSKVREVAVDMGCALFGGHEVKPYKDKYGRGWIRGSISYVDNYDVARVMGAISTKSSCKLEVTGSASDKVFWEILGRVEDIKVTRIDLAVDIELGNPDEKFLSKVYEIMPRKFKKKIALRQSFTGSTLTGGSRRSANYLRVYDKSESYGMDLGSVYRYELEVKKAPADVIAIGLSKSERDTGEYVLNVLAAACRKLHLNFPYGEGYGSNIVSRETMVEDGPNNLHFLMKTALPSVSAALDDIKTEQLVMNVLFPDGVKWEADKTTIKSTKEQDWTPGKKGEGKLDK